MLIFYCTSHEYRCRFMITFTTLSQCWNHNIDKGRIWTLWLNIDTTLSRCCVHNTDGTVTILAVLFTVHYTDGLVLGRQSQHNSGAMFVSMLKFRSYRYFEHNIGTMLYRCWITMFKLYLCWYCEFNIGTMLYRYWTTMLNFNQDSTNHNQISTWYQRWIDVEFALMHQYWQSTWFQHISMLYQCCVLLGQLHAIQYAGCKHTGRIARGQGHMILRLRAPPVDR